MGNLVFQATLGGQVNLVGPNTSSTYNINVPAVAGTMVVTGTSPTFTQVTAPTIGAASSASLALQSNGTTNATLDTSGNLGLGVTPSAWGGTQKAFQVRQAVMWNYNNLENAYVGSNYYFDGTNRKYIITGYATEYSQGSGAHAWFTAASGSAGSTVSFTQAMTLDASGNLGVGTTSPNCKLTINSGAAESGRFIGSGNYITFYNTANSARNAYIQGNDTDLTLNAEGSRNILFNTNGSERARIDTSGNLLVGQTSTGIANSSSYAFQLDGQGIRNNHGNGTPSGYAYMQFGYNGSVIGSITQNGTTGVLYNIASDYRLKEVIGAVSGSGERIDALEPVDYTMKSDGSQHRGFLAHKFQEVYANSVSGVKDAVDEDGNPIYQQMQAGTAEVIADLVSEIQSLRKRLAALEAK